ncbi:hypothetical protein Vretimale_7396 [Volvox reticuliferus]|uniref:Uncharacterized protein n=1 Tax=Volvox reticuliferus TaxID=1737510 RepID=A0A8J4G996_9CHLO|nr:hypothetical protein Vretimale_7396 [Volvox reticuliferus]
MLPCWLYSSLNPSAAPFFTTDFSMAMKASLNLRVSVDAAASVFRTPSAGFSARARRRANAGTCFAPANDAPDMLKPCACLLPPARPAPETLFGCCWCCCDCIGGCLYKAEMLGGPAAAIAKGEPPTTAAERVKAVVQRHQDPRSVLPVLQQLLLRLPPLLPQQHQ